MSALPRESPNQLELRLADDRAEASERAGVLVERIRSGDEGAWPELIALYSPRVFAMCRSRLSSPELAEELTQSVFATLASKLTGENAAYIEEGKFEPWLFRITMNRVRDEARRAKRQAKPTDPSLMPEAGASDEAQTEGQAQTEALRQLRAAVATLPDQDRSIIELRHFSSMSFQAIAELLEVPLGTALARHHRALKKLRTALGNIGFDPAFFD